MIRFPVYTEVDKNGVEKTPFTLYKEAVGRSHLPKKTILQGYETAMQGHYDEYEDSFGMGVVHVIGSHGISEPEASNLRSLYSSESAIINHVRSYFTTSLPSRVYRAICPYCGFQGGGTIEHILPKQSYPEYAIHIKNLIPCCGTCNSKKGEKVRDKKGYPEFINFFYHDLESYEFLKADLAFDDKKIPVFSFRLDLRDVADPILKNAIANHYKNLGLLERYKIFADSKYPECELAIEDKIYGDSDVAGKLMDFSNKITSFFGRNHYYSAMVRALAASPEYHTFLVKKGLTS